MKIMLETTEWNSDSQPNHIYVFQRYHPSDRTAMAIAYVPFGTEPLQKFRTPLQIDLKGRTFVEVGESEPEPAPEPEIRNDEWTVAGSNGRTYTVSRPVGGGMNYQCTCPGFTFRGSCKHTAEFLAQHQYDVR